MRSSALPPPIYVLNIAKRILVAMLFLAYKYKVYTALHNLTNELIQQKESC